jgi:hypothetical protein
MTAAVKGKNNELVLMSVNLQTRDADPNKI